MARVVAVELQVPDDLAPVVQDVEIIGYWNARREQMIDCSNHIGRSHVFALNIVLADDQDSVVGAPLRLCFVVAGRNHLIGGNGVDLDVGPGLGGDEALA